MIRLRVDVDYAYPSRAKSILKMVFGIKKHSHDYLKNSEIIAKMINESPKEVMTYWFFTPYTIPNQKLLELLKPDRHEIALHVAKNPYQEWMILENVTGRKVNYYTVHGTEHLLNQLLWHRKLGEKQVKIPSDFPLKSFHNFPSYSLDFGFINTNCVLSLHPDWLFKRSKNGRGPTFDILSNLLHSPDSLTANSRPKLERK